MSRLLLLVLLCSPLLASVASDVEYKVRVIKVQNAENIVVKRGSKQLKVRLADIDAPEMDQPYGPQSKRALIQKILRQVVVLDKQATDRYGRIIGKVYLEGRDINREMIAEGHAWAYRRSDESEVLLADEAMAREYQVGLWGRPDPIPPWRWRRGDRPVAEQADNQDE